MVFDVVIAELPCRECGHRAERRVQLKYGACWAHEYRVGDRLSWDDGHHNGPRLEGRLWCSCYVEQPCAACGEDPHWATFAVVVDEDVIVDVVQAPAGHIFEDGAVLPLEAPGGPPSVPSR